LLNSGADEYSALNGRELAKVKVTELAVMGGKYPKGRSWNFWGSKPELAEHVLGTWGGKITFVGNDVGRDVLIGGPLMKSELEDDPVRMAYIYFGFGKPRPSWDPLTVFYAANGLGDVFGVVSDRGYNKIEADGSNEWVDDGKDWGQRYLRLEMSAEAAAAQLDDDFLRAAERFSKHATAK